MEFVDGDLVVLVCLQPVTRDIGATEPIGWCVRVTGPLDAASLKGGEWQEDVYRRGAARYSGQVWTSEGEFLTAARSQGWVLKESYPSHTSLWHKLTM